MGSLVERFPRPEFESGHTLPPVEVAELRAPWMDGVDAALLLVALVAATVLVHRGRSRRGLFGLALVSVTYFGFIRQGCICPVGALQNVCLALADTGYVLPVAVAAFFLLPLVFSSLFGRAFCAGVCPLGAIQEIVLLSPVQVPPWLDRPLRWLAWIYLGAAILFATTGSAFVICRYDPFVSFFRLDGSTGRLLLGLGFLLSATVVARPYCRWLCPYGALLGLAARLAARPVKITAGECTRCNRCSSACPVDAIRPAAAGRDPAPVRPWPRARIVLLAALLPLVAAGWWIGGSLSAQLSRVHPVIGVAEQVHLSESGELSAPDDRVDGFWRTGDDPAELFSDALEVRGAFASRTPWLLAGLALLLGLQLVRWSSGRRLAGCEASRADCLACGRCFDACPVNGPPPRRSDDPVRRRAAIVTAVAGTVLVLALSIPMAVSPPGAASPVADERLDDLKLQLLHDREDAALPGEIRDLDVELRQRWMGHRDRSRLGRYLLLLGAVLLLGGAHVARRPTQPPPARARAAADRWVDEQRVTRVALLIGAAALLAGFAVWGLMARRDLATPRYGDDPASLVGPTPEAAGAGAVWPRFRGPGGAGIAAEGTYPTDWDAPQGRGVLWTTPVPLPGKGSPVIAGGRVFVTGADDEARAVYALDAATGELLWRAPVEAAYRPNPEEHWTMTQTGHAASSPAADHRHVYAIFSNGDVAALDHAGAPSWTVNLGAPDSAYGYASSLAILGDRLLIQFDQGRADEGKSELLALDTDSGRFAWRARRPVEGSWTTPITFDHGGRRQIVSAANPWIHAHDPDGQELWRVGGLRGDGAASPLYAGGLVLVVTPGERVTAIRPDGEGDVTQSHVVWTTEGSFPDLCSPVSDGERLWLLNRDGRLSCLSMRDGAKLGEVKLEGWYSASPTLAGGHLYCLNEAGTMFVVGTQDQPAPLGRSELGERAWASPAFAQGRIYLRGEGHVTCVGNP